MKKVTSWFKAMIVAAIVGISAALPSAAHADLTAMQTAATDAITAAETSVVAILVAGLVITIALWSYGKIKAAIRKN